MTMPLSIFSHFLLIGMGGGWGGGGGLGCVVASTSDF